MTKKTIVITGAAAGLGREICRVLSPGDFDVHPVDHALGHDVRAPDAAEGLVAFKSVPKLDELDILVNCAGINRISWLENVTDELWDTTLDTNAKSIYKMTQHYLVPLSRRRGTVLNIVSNASHMPMRGSIAYNASRALHTS